MKNWRDLSFNLKIYLVSVVVFTFLLLIFGIWFFYIAKERHIFLQILVFFASCAAAYFKTKQHKNYIVALDGIFAMTLAMLVPWQFTFLPIFFSSILSELVDRQKMYVCLFNASSSSISTFLSAFFIQRLAPLGYPQDMVHAGIVLIGGLIFITTNELLVSGAIALNEGYQTMDILSTATIFDKKIIFAAFTEIAGGIAFAYVIVERNFFVLGSLIAVIALTITALKKEEKLRETIRAAAYSLLETIGARDDYTKNHCLRVAKLASLTAKELKLSYPEVEIAEFAGLLHDLGKISFPDNLFTQKRIEDEAWNQIKSHPVTAKRILNGMNEFILLKDYIELHHERHDGKGYPYGYKGSQIPIAAQILAVCDTFDAMTSERAYRKAFPPEIALKEILTFKGVSFHPKIVDAFTRVVKKYYGVTLATEKHDMRKKKKAK